MTYKLNEIEVSKEQIQKLIKDNPEIMEDSGRWAPEEDEEYWLVDNNGGIYNSYWTNHKRDKFRLSTGNMFKTEDEAQAHLDYLKAVAVIKEDAEWWVPDWGDGEQDKWAGHYWYSGKGLSYDRGVYVMFQGAIYFKSEEAIKKSQETHRKEWLLMFGIKED